MSSFSNGAVIVKSFADLASVIDVENLPAGPTEPTTALTNDQSSMEDQRGDQAADAAGTEIVVTPPLSAPLAAQDLAGLVAQLARMSSGLETMAREDARAREQATVELAQYEALAADRGEAERALAEARQVRATAERLVCQAFSKDARDRAAEHAALARAAELQCVQLLAQCVRAADELASRPYLAQVLAERGRREEERADAVRQEAADRAQRLATGLDAARQALRDERPDDAVALLDPLVRQFPSDANIRRALDTAAWQSRRRVVGPAEEALRDIHTRAYRQDPEQAMRRLATVAVDGLPEELARQLFGVWSDLCLKVVQQRGWVEPRRYAPQTSRGVVLARPAGEEPHQVVSALGLADWRVGDVVTAPGVLRSSRPLQERKRPPTAAAS